MKRYTFLPSINREYGESNILSISPNQSILSYNKSNKPIIIPNLSKYSKKKTQQCSYLTKATEILNSFPPSPSGIHCFKYSRLAGCTESPPRKHKNYFLKPIIQKNRQTNQFISISMEVDPKILKNSMNYKKNSDKCYHLRKNRKIILSKISNYSSNLGMSDSDSNDSEDEYHLQNKLETI